MKNEVDEEIEVDEVDEIEAGFKHEKRGGLEDEGD